MSKLREYLEVTGAVTKLLLANLDLAYYYLPRSWRGGYRSPWERDS